MYPLPWIRQARLCSASSALLQRFSAFNWVSQASFNGFPGCLKSFSAGPYFSEDVGNARMNLDQQRTKENASDPYSTFRSSIHPSGQQSTVNVGNVDMDLGQQRTNENVSASFAGIRSFMRPSGQHSTMIDGNAEMNFGTGPRDFKSMNFVRDVIKDGGQSIFGGSQSSRYTVEHDADFVHIKLLRNNTFVTVTDANGNKKCGASSGHLSELKGGPKVSRYAAEATAEHVGRMARNMGIKSVVVRVKGFTHFKKKKQAILSFREGFSTSRSDKNPVVYIEDTTRRAHNGCRLPKKRRI